MRLGLSMLEKGLTMSHPSALLVDMEQNDLIREISETKIETLLACGHWAVVSAATSGWDFPDEPHWCHTCETSIQWHPALQMLAYEKIT